MAAEPMPFEEAREANRLLSRLFGTKDDDLHVVLFRLNPARSVSYVDVVKAVGDAAGDSDVYVHVGLARRAFNGGDRPTALEIDALGGLWADIDIAHAVHKKRGLPPDEAGACAVIQSMGLTPGLIINSGHGLQAHWPFSAVWTFDDDDERRRARILARAWAITLRERAKQLGYTVDMVSDISRVLRVAGTVNAKASPVPVTILEQNASTVSEDDVLSVLLDGTWEQAERDIDQKKASGDDVIYGDLTLDPKADPPFDRFVTLCEAAQEAEYAWRRKRTRKTDHYSPSEWDMVLANYASRAGWSRQEIANLIIAARRKHGDDLKLRQDYFRATIDKATADQEEQEAIFEAIAAATESPAGPSDTERTDLLAKLSAGIGIEITRFTRSRSEPPVFGIETPKGNGSLGGISALISNRKFREKVAELTNVIPRPFKTDAWDAIAQRLLELAELEDLGVETTVAGRAQTLISLYLGAQAPQSLGKMDDRVRRLLPISLSPYVGEDGRARIFSTGFKVWLAEVHHEVMSAQEIGTMLRAISAEPETVNFKTDHGRTTRALWILPAARTGDE